ncbi:MAG: hypothetical protein ACLQU5_02010 [Isosphaeraceae bacterium]
MGNTRLTIEDLPVVLVLAALGWTTRTPADPGRRRPEDAAAMGWRWDSAAPSPRPRPRPGDAAAMGWRWDSAAPSPLPRPPGPIRRRWELSAAESQPPPARPAP